MKLRDEIAAWLREYLAATGADGFVLGLSGGVDSAVTAALAVQAVGPESVLAAILPCHSEPIDAVLAGEVIDALKIPSVTVDLDEAFDALMRSLPRTDHRLATANIKPRLRMTALYYLAQTRNYLVLGCSNKSEWLVGYSTKYGDSAADLLPLGHVYKTEVWQLARELGVPRRVIERPPSAGLWPGQTDEDELGISYAELDRILEAIASGDTDNLDSASLGKVKSMIAGSAHKRAMPPVFRRSRD